MMDTQMDGWMKSCMDGMKDAWMEEWMDVCMCVVVISVYWESWSHLNSPLLINQPLKRQVHISSH